MLSLASSKEWNGHDPTALAYVFSGDPNFELKDACAIPATPKDKQGRISSPRPLVVVSLIQGNDFPHQSLRCLFSGV